MLVKQKNGFTLLEIMVVVAIVGIVSGLGIYNLLSMLPQIRANSAARQVSSDMQWARLKSVSENNDVIITFYSPDGTGAYRYEILDDDNNNGSTDSGEALFTGDKYTLPVTIRFGRATSGIERTTCGGEIGSSGIHFTGNKITFQPSGRPNKNGSVYIIPIKEDENNEKKTINWRAISVTTNGRIKTWIYDASVENCASGLGPWR